MQTNITPHHFPAYISMEMLCHIVSFKIFFTRSLVYVFVCFIHG